MGAATALLLAGVGACGDLTIPGADTRSLSELLVLAQQAGAPAVAGAQVWVANDRETVRLFQHQDAFNQLYARLRFPPGALAALDGAALGPTDSVLVTVQPHAGRYGLSLSPAGLAFTPGSRPSVVFSYGRYGDLGVADGSSYPSHNAYADALDVWREVGLDRWRIATGSAAAGLDAVSAFLDEGGDVVLAAPR